MDKFLKMVGAIVVSLMVICAIAAIFTYPVKWLVNYLFTPATIYTLFGVSQLTFWKAMALSTVCSLLFKYSTGK